MRYPQDKEAFVLKQQSQHDVNDCLVFVGDGWNDLLALTQANVGIIMDPDTAMQRMCHTFGMALMPITSCNSLMECKALTAKAREAGECLLFQVTNWDAIRTVMKA